MASCFTYTPLPDPATYIRLLRFDEECTNTDIRCSIAHFDATSAPPYDAVSYTWGEATPLVDILVDGQAFAVRINCYYALRQLYWYRLKGYFWVDSVCINQGDLVEKTMQVQRMHSTFSDADEVHVSVGKHGHGSHILINGIRVWHQGLASYDDLYVSDLSYRDSGFDCSASMTEELRSYNWTAFNLKTKPRRAKGVYFLLHNLGRRSYWRRQWVLQELCLAKKARLHCAGLSMRLMVLRDFSQAMALGGWWMQYSVPMERMLSLVSDCMESRRLQFDKLLLRAFDLECSDVRDHIYGMIALVKWGMHDPPTPDYQIHALDLAMRCFKYIWRDFADPESDMDVMQWTAWCYTNLLLRMLDVTQGSHRVDALLKTRSIHRRTELEIDATARSEALGSNVARHMLYRSEYKILGENKQGLLGITNGLHTPHDNPDSWIELLQTFENARSQSNSGLHPEYPVLYEQDKIIGILPMHSQSADWLVPINRSGEQRYQLCLVVRPNHTGCHQIIGQALLNHAHYPRTPDASMIEIYFTKEDWLALVVQDDYSRYESQSITTELARLAVGVSPSTFGVDVSGVQAAALHTEAHKEKMRELDEDFRQWKNFST